MRQIHYASEELLTGTDIAEAMMEYAQTLASHEASDTVEIPVIGAENEIVWSSFLIGPASQIVSVDAPEYEGEEIRNEGVVAHLRELTRLLINPGNAGPLDDGNLQRIEDFS